MKRILLSFGDSWAYGCELSVLTREQDNYTGQLSRMIGVDHTFNFSEPGSSISHLQIQLRRAVDTCNNLHTAETIAIFFLTGQQRFLMFDSQKEFVGLAPTGAVIRPNQNHLRDQLESINNFYYRNMQSQQADIINLNTNLLALQAICKFYNIRDYYISGWEKLNLWPEVDQSRICKPTCADILKLDSDLKNKEFIADRGTHPNANGHKQIAQFLYEIIDNDLNTLYNSNKTGHPRP